VVKNTPGWPKKGLGEKRGGTNFKGEGQRRRRRTPSSKGRGKRERVVKNSDSSGKKVLEGITYERGPRMYHQKLKPRERGGARTKLIQTRTAIFGQVDYKRRLTKPIEKNVGGTERRGDYRS